MCFKTFGAGKLVASTTGYGQPLPPEVDPSSLAPTLSVDDCIRVTLTPDPYVAIIGLSPPGEQDAAFSADVVRNKGAIWWDPPAT